jgi:DNA-binding protein YbaB
MSETQLRYVPQAEGHVSPFGRAVDAMHVTATAAGDALYAEVDGWYAVRVTVAPGHAEHADDGELAVQLTQLARRLFVARTREYYRLMDLHLQPNPVSLRRSRDRLEAAVEDRQATGYAEGGAVEVTSIGMKEFVVQLQPGTGARLGSEALGAALTTAANDMVAAWLLVLADYKMQLWSR